jgi:hypothetical protein
MQVNCRFFRLYAVVGRRLQETPYHNPNFLSWGSSTAEMLSSPGDARDFSISKGLYRY